MAGVDAMLL
jgi:hypothetical protein